jgi:phosphatidylserine/phosphatidylglycerophosphate/cardiolipin synthase-like enzyme
MYGSPGKLEPQAGPEFEIRTEKEFDQGHGVWFNRGAIASQVFARRFENKAPPEPDNPDSPETKWLSRGLLDACLQFINETPKGDGLRVAAYEFTYKPILDALKDALDRGVDVRIVYHYEPPKKKEKKCENEIAIETAKLPQKHGGRQVLFRRTRTVIPHNKFIIRLTNGTRPAMVWTGSTNFTASGFLGQSNVGHLIEDQETAKQYLDYWETLQRDPERDKARSEVMKLTPDPAAVLPENSITPVFSPRPKSDMLKWYGRRITNAMGSVMITSPFGVSETLIEPLAEVRDFRQ